MALTGFFTQPLLLLCCTFIIAVAGAAKKELELQAFKTRFFEECPEAQSKDLPNELAIRGSFDDEMDLMTFNVSVFLRRVVEVNDLAQTMTLFMMTIVTWDLPCTGIPKKNLTDAKVSEDSFAISANSSEIWHPKLEHKNAAVDAYALERLPSEIAIFPLWDPPAVEIDYLGTIVSACDDFSFKRFPFDTLTCSVEFETSASSSVFLTMGPCYFQIDRSSDILGNSDIWQFVPPLNCTVRLIPRGMDFFTSVGKFTISLQRKYNYYVNIIFVPMATLFLLQVMALFIEPSAPDRAAFCMAVDLSFAVVLAMVFALIPKTSEDVYLVKLIVVKFAVAAILTVYALVTQPIGDTDWAMTSIVLTKRYKISLIRAIDIVFGLGSLLTGFLAYLVYLNRMIYE